MKTTLLAEASTPHPADVVLFLPTTDGTWLVVGTYLLDERSRSRTGGLCVFLYAAPSLTVQRQVSCDAVLDVKIVQNTHTHTTLAVAHATGVITVWHLSIPKVGSESQVGLVKVGEWQVADQGDTENLVLSVQVLSRDRDFYVLSTHSKGDAAVSRLRLDGDVQIAVKVVARLRAAELECWIGAMASVEGGGVAVWAGSDDASLCRWTLPEVDVVETIDGDGFAIPEWRNSKLHGAGVVAIRPFWEGFSPTTASGTQRTDPVWLMTGSYDDHLRLVSAASPGRAVASIKLPGGVWRIVPLPTSVEGSTDVLVCCMYGGAAIVRLLHDALSFELLTTFDRHDSIVYGGDFL
ncbi:hypothetical protein PYCC9005_001709 [Savitreella phatthalungensis]